MARPEYLADEPPAEGSEEAAALASEAAAVEALADTWVERLRSLSQVGRWVSGGGGGARTRARRYHNPFPHLLTIIRWAFNRRPKDRCGRCRGWRCRGWLVGPTD